MSRPTIRSTTQDSYNDLLSPATLIFHDDFNSLDTIDVNNTGLPGFNWYLRRAFGYPYLNPTSITVGNSILTLNNTGSNHAQFDLCSAMGTTGGAHIGFAPSGKLYFEAAIKFNPADFASKVAAFWSMATQHVFANSVTAVPYHYIELDFMEFNQAWDAAMLAGTGWYNTNHVWTRTAESQTSAVQGSKLIKTGLVNFNEFHTYGCLWEPGVKIETWFDRMKMRTLLFESHPNLAAGNSQNFPIILGSPGANLMVDWVKVYGF
jgi:hypothetical protein